MVKLYEVTRIPDLTLSKYSALDESGVEGVLKKHLAFFRQVYREMLGSVRGSADSCSVIHWICKYDPNLPKGGRLRVFLGFDCANEIDFFDTMIRNSPLAPFYDISSVDENELGSLKMSEYRNMAVLIKREKLTDAGEMYAPLYSVSKWEVNESARLFGLYSMMGSLNQPCAYCVDIRPVDYADRIESRGMLGFVMSEYMRQSDSGNAGFSMSSGKDEAVGYALERYKETIKDIAANPHFMVNVRAYADSEDLACMILDSAASEALSEGSHDIVVDPVSGFYFGEIIETDVIDNTDIGRDVRLYSNKLGNRRENSSIPAFLSVMFTIKELIPFVVLPALYPGESIEMRKETAPKSDSSDRSEKLYLGRDSDGCEMFIPLKNLTKHAFLAGVPGSGKTNSMLHLATELHRKGVPFLILEPAKQEYRALANLPEMNDIAVFSPSSGTKFPLHINPFEFPKGMSLAEHIRNLINVFEGAFYMDGPTPHILDRAIEHVYREKNWLPYMINDGELEYPTMKELYSALEKVVAETDYEGDIRGNIKSFLEVRVGSLLSREMGDVFDVPFSTIAPEDWLKRSVVIELESMGSGPANFLTLMLSTLIRETLKVNPLTRQQKREMPVRHCMFFEEAHNLIGQRTESPNGETADPKIAATAFIVKMLAEVRALNEAIIIADQLPTAMASEVLKNTSLKIGHRITSADERNALGGTMSADNVQLERMATFLPGRALAVYEGLLKPFEFSMHQWSKQGVVTDDNLYTSPSDEELLQKLCCDGSPFMNDLKRSFEITCRKMDARWCDISSDFESLKSDCDECIIIGTEEEIRSKCNSRGCSEEQIQDYLKTNDSVRKEKEAEFRSICDRVDEAHLSISFYRRQNQKFDDEVRQYAGCKLMECYKPYKVHFETKFGWKRSEREKEALNNCLKHVCGENH